MAFDPNYPPQNALLESAPIRNQFNGLKDLIDNIPAGPQGPQGDPGPPGADGAQGPQGPEGPPGPTAVIVDQNDPGGAQGTIWIRPSDGTVFVRVGAGWEDRGTMKGQQGDPGAQGAPGPEGPQGNPGEVTAQQLSDAIAGTARNPSGQMGNLDPNWTPSGDTNADLIWLRDRLVELYNAEAR